MGKKKFILSIIVVLILLALSIALYQKKIAIEDENSDIVELLKPYEELYEEHGVELDCVTKPSKDKIKIRFYEIEGKHDAVTSEGFIEISNTVIDLLYEEESLYKDYELEIGIFARGPEDQFWVWNITPEMDNIKVLSRQHPTNISMLIESFPGIIRLDIDYPIYDELNEIEGLENLQSLRFTRGLTQEEIDYILSIYPDCDVSDTPIITEHED